MLRLIYFNFFGVFSLLVPDVGFSRQIYYGSETETISIAYGGPTIFRFNDAVKTISEAAKFNIKPSDEENPNYAVLSVTPRFSAGQNKVTFILANSAVINVKIVTVAKAIPERTDSFYDFKPKETMLENMEKDQGTAGVSELELMKAMIRGDTVTGYKVEPMTTLVDTGDAKISARLVRIYTGSKYNGYIFKIKNHEENTKYVIDLEQLALGRPNTAILSQVDQNVLEPASSGKNVTHVRVVAKPSSVYYNINLPVAPIADPSK